MPTTFDLMLPDSLNGTTIQVYTPLHRVPKLAAPYRKR